MRSRSIISVLRRQGRLRRTKSRIKYEEALKRLQAYQNSELQLKQVVDNVRYPKKSISKKCQLEGCGSIIRWEYTLESKITGERIIAGSTCVWVMLGLSEEEIKAFTKAEYSIKAFHDMLEWKSENEDVYEKLQQLKENNIWFFKPFWEEIDYCRLCEEDTQYIRDVDLDAELKRKAEKERTKSKLSSIVDNLKNSNNYVKERDPEFEKVVKSLDELHSKYPNDSLIHSMYTQASSGKVLSDNQIHKIKALTNKEYFLEKIKGTEEEVHYNHCDATIIHRFRVSSEARTIRIYYMDIQKINSVEGVKHMIVKYQKQFHEYINNQKDPNIKKLWKYYRIKHEIVVK